MCTNVGLISLFTRISVILRVFKARIFHTKDSELLYRLGGALLIALIYLSIWTATYRSHAVYLDAVPAGCSFVWPHALAIAGTWLGARRCVY